MKDTRRDVNVLNDLTATIGFLKGCAAADTSRLGIVGFCMGGRIAFLAAAATRSFKAAVDFYGGGCYQQWGERPDDLRMDRRGNLQGERKGDGRISSRARLALRRKGANAVAAHLRRESILHQFLDPFDHFAILSYEFLNQRLHLFAGGRLHLEPLPGASIRSLDSPRSPKSSSN